MSDCFYLSQTKVVLTPGPSDVEMYALGGFISVMAEEFPLARNREDFALLKSLIYAPQVFVLDVEKALKTVEAPTM